MNDKSDKINKFIQENSPDGGFLQSEEWRKFQEAVGRRTFNISSDGFWANIIEHKLPVVGRYFYIPRGPVIGNSKFEILNPKQIQNSNIKIQNFFNQIINLAKKENAGWIRIEPNDKKFIEIYRNLLKFKIVKAPHDMQPREVFIIDITKSEEQLLSEMKSKTRYNIKLSQKHGVSVKVLTNNKQLTTNNYFEEFLKLVKITAQRDKITPHPENYYRKMFEIMPSDTLKLYVAEYDNKIIAANIVIFYGNMATYLHGASDYNFRDVMAPHLLQWQAILDAKKAGLNFYDLGGVKITNNSQPTTNNWYGITRFKTGFAPNTKPVVFPGSYDIVLNSFKYNIYRILQKIKNLT